MKEYLFICLFYYNKQLYLYSSRSSNPLKRIYKVLNRCGTTYKYVSYIHINDRKSINKYKQKILTRFNNINNKVLNFPIPCMNNMRKISSMDIKNVIENYNKILNENKDMYVFNTGSI